ncbi:MAG: hypothetical protein GY710_19935 [Desulfobacteraceae bacterium]|nr:hypothetical protein [Desulfobacteraceae bacterium]
MKIRSIHIIHGFKTAIAGILAYAITMFFNLNFGGWSVISTVIVMQLYVADSIEMCVYRLSGTIIGAIMGVIVILVFPLTHLGIGSGLFLTIGLCSCLTQYQPKYRMAAITVVIVVMTGMNSPNIIQFALFRVTEISLGILCATAVSLVILPRKKSDVLRKKLETQAVDCAEKCNILVSAFLSKQHNVEEALMDDLITDVWNNQNFFLNIRRHEALIYKLNENFSAKVLVIGRVAEHLRNMVRILNSMDSKGYNIFISKQLVAVAKISGDALVALMKNNPSDHSFKKKQLELALQEFDNKLLDIRKEGLTSRFDLKRLVQVFSFFNSLKYFAEDILSGADNILPKKQIP